KDDNRMQPHSLEVHAWAGKMARLQIVDNEKGGWGNIGIDDIVFSDEPRIPAVALAEQSDFGTMGLGLLKENGAENTPADVGATLLPEQNLPTAIFSESAPDSDAPVSRPFGQKLAGAVTRRL